MEMKFNFTACGWTFCVPVLMLMVLLSTAAIGKPDMDVVVTDLAGREVHFRNEPKRIILGESRHLFALSILDTDNPLQRVVGMLADLKSIDPGSYRQYQQRFPEIDRIPLVGHTSADSFSVEQALSLRADLAIFGLEGHGPNSKNHSLIQQLEKAGVKVVFIDFRHDPLTNTVKSIALLGKVLRKQARAQSYLAFYQQELSKVLDHLPSKEKVPSVFLHSRVGSQDLCCETMARGMMAAYVDAAKGLNIAKSKVPGSAGVLNLEYVLSLQPDLYIATAIGSISNTHKAGSGFPYVVLGPGVSEQDAQQSLNKAIQNSHLKGLQAIKNSKAHAIWHHFYNTPLNVVAVQVFAKWFYPEVFHDLNPQKTLSSLYENFQSVPLQGIYWITLSQSG